MDNQANGGPIANVREGMQVVDAAGEDIGTVDQVQAGDPDTATLGEGDPETVGGTDPDISGAAERDTSASGFGGSGGGGLLSGLSDVIGGDDDTPDVPPEMSARLMRLGFIRIDGKGLTGNDRYVTADWIDSVSGDTVRLNVRAEEMGEA